MDIILLVKFLLPGVNVEPSKISSILKNSFYYITSLNKAPLSKISQPNIGHNGGGGMLRSQREFQKLNYQPEVSHLKTSWR